MKKKLLSLIVLQIVGQIAFGQTYYPLCDTIKKWNVLETDGWGGGSRTCVLKISYDTIINFVSYKKVVSEPATQGFFGLPGGFVREDSIKQIFYMPYGSNSEYLLYDFNVEIDDTVNVYNFYGLGELLVETIDTTSLTNGENRKRWGLRDLGWGVHDEWIEGIGSIYGLLSPGGICPDCPNQLLLCYYENDTAMYTSDLDTCFINSVGIMENPYYKNQIYPNPASDKLFINIENVKSIKICNIQGVIINNIPPKEKQIDVSALSVGIYFMHILSDNNSILYKFIKL